MGSSCRRPAAFEQNSTAVGRRPQDTFPIICLWSVGHGTGDSHSQALYHSPLAAAIGPFRAHQPRASRRRPPAKDDIRQFLTVVCSMRVQLLAHASDSLVGAALYKTSTVSDTLPAKRSCTHFGGISSGPVIAKGGWQSGTRGSQPTNPLTRSFRRPGEGMYRNLFFSFFDAMSALRPQRRACLRTRMSVLCRSLCMSCMPPATGASYSTNVPICQDWTWGW